MENVVFLKILWLSAPCHLLNDFPLSVCVHVRQRWASPQPGDCLQRRSRQNENIINQYPTTAVFDKFLSDAWCFTTVNEAPSLSSGSERAVLLLLLASRLCNPRICRVWETHVGEGRGKGRGCVSCSYFCVRCHRCLSLHIQVYI